MNINLPSFVKKPTEWKGIEHKLVLTYPFLVDSNIDQRYIEDLRDFFSVIFINHIKLSNFLSIASSALSDNKKATEISSIIHKVLSGTKGASVSPEVMSSGDITTRYEVVAKNLEYQRYINDRLNYITKLMEKDPYISKLKPFITMITVDKKDVMINVPIIIGTKVFNCEHKTNFWIILAALLFNRRLMSKESLDNVKSILDRMSPINFYRYITNSKMREELLSRIGIKPLRSLPPDKDSIESVSIMGLTLTLYSDGKLFISKITDSPYIAIIREFIDSIYKSETFEKAKDIIDKFLLKYKDKASKIINSLKQIRDIFIPSSVDPKMYISIKKMEDISAIIHDSINKTLNFWKKALDRDEWDKFTGVHSITPSEVFSTSVARVHPKCYDKMNKSRRMFDSYMSTLINPLLLSIAGILELHYEPYSLDSLLKNIISKVSESYVDFSNNVWGIINDSMNVIGKSESPGDIDSRIESFRSSLLSIGDYISFLENITTISENLRVGSITIMKGDDGFNKIVNIANRIIEISRKLETYADSIVKHMKSVMVVNTYESDFLGYVNEFRKKSIGLISIIDNLSTNPSDHPSLFEAFKISHGGGDEHILRNKFSRFVRELAHLMSVSFDRIVYFLGVISVSTFVADAFELIKYEATVVSREATDFPNYCIVLPFGLLDSFYQVKLTDITSESILSSGTDNIFFKGKIGEKDPSKIVDAITESLGIPNIIVIDKSSDEFYYRFMFMNSTRKFKLSAIKSFIQSQKEIISL
ncbi:MAG: hypothetical protein QXD03_03715 [Candidatus Anstonellales archaeon]